MAQHGQSDLHSEELKTLARGKIHAGYNQEGISNSQLLASQKKMSDETSFFEKYSLLHDIVLNKIENFIRNSWKALRALCYFMYFLSLTDWFNKKTTRFSFFLAFHYMLQSGFGMCVGCQECLLCIWILLTFLSFFFESLCFFWWIHKTVIFTKQFQLLCDNSLSNWKLPSSAGSILQSLFQDLQAVTLIRRNIFLKGVITRQMAEIAGCPHLPHGCGSVKPAVIFNTSTTMFSL